MNTNSEKMEDRSVHTWGGARPGSGRKPAKPGCKRVQMVITVDRETYDSLKWCRMYRHMRPGWVIDHLVSEHLNNFLLEN